MKDCATNKLQFETPTSLALEAAFDGGRLTSDGGLLWLSEVDKELGLCLAMANKHVPEWRKREGRHSLTTLFKQRVFQIACGYTRTRTTPGPFAKTPCSSWCVRFLARECSGAGFPTHHLPVRENAVSARACYLMAKALFELYLRERAKNGTPKKVLLDLDDSTDDPTHGDQEGSYYHGATTKSKSSTRYSSLTVGALSSLRPCLESGQHPRQSSWGALDPQAHREEAQGKAWGEDVHIEIRADAGFAVPEIYDYCEKEGIGYTIGLISNPRLEALAEDLLERAKRESEQGAGEKVRLLSSASYRAGTWERSRRVIYKAEVLEKGTNTRFVVTSRFDEPEELYEWYIRGGRSGGVDKVDFKRALKADRLSCHRFFANQFSGFCCTRRPIGCWTHATQEAG